jgi:uncharacterized protein
MTESADNTIPLGPLRAARGGRCPICGKPTLPETRPFCSRRCKDVDLARWLGEVYRVSEPDPAGGDVGPDASGDDED